MVHGEGAQHGFLAAVHGFIKSKKSKSRSTDSGAARPSGGAPSPAGRAHRSFGSHAPRCMVWRDSCTKMKRGSRASLP
jgi:hypothetical protein